MEQMKEMEGGIWKNRKPTVGLANILYENLTVEKENNNDQGKILKKEIVKKNLVSWRQFFQSVKLSSRDRSLFYIPKK